MDTKAIKELNNLYIMNTYGDRQLAIVRGDGTKVWDADGNEYLDFFSGIAVISLGHCHPEVVAAVKSQAERLFHVSNLYYIEPQVKLAQKLAANSFADKWFFCNSGAEANEAAIKIARKYWFNKGEARPGIIAMDGSFHGRTLMTITATGQAKYKKGFAPLMPGFKHVPFNDVDAVAGAIDETTGAVLVEPIQGESGVRVPSDDYLAKLRELCDDKGLLLIFDEVQTGLGRTGSLFCYEHSGIAPDIITLAKSLAGGVPIGAMGATDEVAAAFQPGDHASTFGGNPIATSAACAVMDVLTKPGFIDGVAQTGDYLFSEVRAALDGDNHVVEIRGKGMMMGVELSVPAKEVVGRLLAGGIIAGTAGEKVLRFLPPLIITEAEVDTVVAALRDAMKELPDG